VNKGERAAFPQARLVALVECGTHAIFEAGTGAYGTSEVELARELVGRLSEGMLVLVDRGFYGYRLFTQASATGADLLWRTKTATKARHLETLDDGSWLGEITPGGNEGRHATPAEVRVIDYTIDEGREHADSYRLLTTILDPKEAGAEELARVRSLLSPPSGWRAVPSPSAALPL
jgi:hypothetical protein